MTTNAHRHRQAVAHKHRNTTTYRHGNPHAMIHAHAHARSRHRRRRTIIITSLTLAGLCLCVVIVDHLARSSAASTSHDVTSPAQQVSDRTGTGLAPSARRLPEQHGHGYAMSRQRDPDRVVVTDRTGRWLATFTDGSRTVTVRGSRRTFIEPSTTRASVTHDVWVRTLDQPFKGSVDTAWLSQIRAVTTTDLLALAMQYVSGAPAMEYGSMLIAGDASYGPVEQVTSGITREEGSDFNDYLGINWHYDNAGNGPKDDKPERRQIQSMDCSGYMRMVWGYRSGLPMSLEPVVGAIPRRAVNMEAHAPGTMILTNTGAQAARLDALQAGDWVFFDASTDDSTAIDHVGMYLGRDDGGHYRFISSRKTADGPTLGDVGGASLLDGSGLYATSFRSARRL